MRRTSAMALFAVLVIPAILPLLVSPIAKPEFLLPACCRREGKHHCAMATAKAEPKSQESSFRQEPAACRYRSGSVVLSHSFSFYPPQPTASHVAVVQQPATQAQTVLRQLAAEGLGHQKRGPPALLS